MIGNLSSMPLGEGWLHLKVSASDISDVVMLIGNLPESADYAMLLVRSILFDMSSGLVALPEKLALILLGVSFFLQVGQSFILTVSQSIPE